MNNRMRTKINFILKRAAKHWYLDNLTYDKESEGWIYIDKTCWVHIILPKEDEDGYIWTRIFNSGSRLIDLNAKNYFKCVNNV